MLKVGFPISRKVNEQRRALIPPHLKNIEHVQELVFEKGYGEPLGYTDQEYRRQGASVEDVATVQECPIICSAKPLSTEAYFGPGKTLFGWIHAVQDRKMTDVLVAHNMNAIAWEAMFEQKRHTFWRNNEISGEAAVLHAVTCWGRLPWDCTAALIGLGNVGRGAFRVLERLGCRVTVYDEFTSPLVRSEIGRYDVLVNAVLWDVFRNDHLIYETDLEEMRPGSMIIDISCDPNGGIETSRPTTLTEPVFRHKEILHYAVDHTPTLFFKSATESISKEVARFIDPLIGETEHEVLKTATIVQGGVILDENITRYQNR